MDFSETIAACDLKVGRCRQLIEIMKVCEYCRSMSFLYHIFSRLDVLSFARPRYQVSVYRTIGPLVSVLFLAHLSRRLTGELIGYPWIRRPSSVRPSSSVHIFKHLLLRNRLANQSQILCGASLGRGNESLYR